MKTKYQNKRIETERCIFIDAETLKGDTECVQAYELTGEETNQALEDIKIAKILKGKA